MSELELTFSCNEDYMGQVVTYDLVPGGRTIAVNNENKYVVRRQRQLFGEE